MMVTIYIGECDLRTITADELEMTVRPLYAEIEEEVFELSDCTFPQEVSAVQFAVVEPPEVHPLDIPDNVLRATASFLTNHHAQMHMDYMCFDFVHEIVFRNSRQRVTQADGDWQLHHITDMHTFRPGEIIKLHRGSEGAQTTFAHAAVYLGRELFLSVYGAGGDLEVATLKNMRQDFNAPYVALATPRY